MARKRRARPPARRRGVRPAVDIVIASPLWTAQRSVKTLLRRAIGEAASATSTAAEGELAIVLTDDSTIQGLNRNWRRKDAPTNVLSFPVTNHVCPLALAQRHRNGAQTTDAKGRERGAVHSPLGDIVISYETTEREARAECLDAPARRKLPNRCPSICNAGRKPSASRSSLALRGRSRPRVNWPHSALPSQIIRRALRVTSASRTSAAA